MQGLSVKTVCVLRTAAFSGAAKGAVKTGKPSVLAHGQRALTDNNNKICPSHGAQNFRPRGPRGSVDRGRDPVRCQK